MVAQHKLSQCECDWDDEDEPCPHHKMEDDETLQKILTRHCDNS